MKAIHELLHGRTRVRRRYALMPLDGFPTSRLPAWSDTDARVLAAPALGAAFVEYLLDMRPGATGRYEADNRIESFFYVLSGSVELNTWTAQQSTTHLLGEGGFGFAPAEYSLRIKAVEAAKILMLRKRFEPGPEPPTVITNHESNVRREMYMGNTGARLQTLIPDDARFDLAMNIFTFDPGHGLPYVETHVMEHGLLFLEGKGVYYLDDEWMEVQAGDFIWMGPFCPQTFYATGNAPSRYIYYKNVNREIEL